MVLFIIVKKNGKKTQNNIERSCLITMIENLLTYTIFPRMSHSGLCVVCNVYI